MAVKVSFWEAIMIMGMLSQLYAEYEANEEAVMFALQSDPQLAKFYFSLRQIYEMVRD